MNAQSDPQLLRAYAERRSEAAFAELVRRHIDLVHSAAVRMVNDPHLAKDVSQGVFVALAKDADKLTNHPVLSGWLHRTARNIAAQTVRTEVRRRHREQEAAAMNEHSETDAPWAEIAPQLDAALADLSEPDRDAVLLRYFENKPAQEMAALLGISAEAAQKRVSRAVERLRENFAKRGLTAGTAGLAGAISTNAVQAAPVGLAAAVSSAALAGTISAAATAKVVAVSSLRKVMIAIAVAGAIGTAVHQSGRVLELQRENQTLQQAFTRQATRMIRPSVTQPGGPGSVITGHEESAEPFQVMASVGGPSDPMEFSLIAPAGRGITTGAAEAAGLNADQKKAVDRILRTMWKRVTDDFASRAKLVEAESDTQKGILVFSVPARSDLGREFVRQLETSLDAEVGETKRRILIQGVDQCDFLGGFGALDVRLSFPRKGVCEYAFSDPKSGTRVQWGEMGFDSFVDKFGTSFELPETSGYPRYH